MDNTIKILTAVADYLRERGHAAALYVSYAGGEPLAVAVPCIAVGMYPTQRFVRYNQDTNMLKVFATSRDGAYCWGSPYVIGELEIADPSMFDQLEEWINAQTYSS